MLIAASFLVPLLIAVTAGYFRDALPRLKPSAVLALVVVLSIGSVTAFLFLSHSESEVAQLAWNGLCQASGAAELIVGAQGVAPGIGWPTGSHSPSVRFRPDSSSGNAILELGEGPGVLLASVTGPQREVIGAAPLSGRVSQHFGSLEIESRSERSVWPFEPSHLIVVKVSSAQVPAPVAVTTDPIADRRLRRAPVVLRDLLKPAIARLRGGTRDEVILSGILDAEAASFLIFSHGGGLYLRDAGSTADAVLPLSGARLELRQPGGRRLEMHLRENNGLLCVDFAAPWRVATRLPPRSPVIGSDQRISRLVVGAEPRPGEAVFQLPLLGKASLERAVLQIEWSDEHARFEEDPQNTDVSRITGTRLTHTDASDLPGLVSDRLLSFHGLPNVRVGLVQDVLTPGEVTLALTVALICVLFCSWIALGPSSDERAWVHMIVVSVAWVLLLFRLVLAMRITLEPALIDRLAVQGVALACAYLTLIPALLLILPVVSREVLEGPVRYSAGPSRGVRIVVAILLAYTCCAMVYRLAGGFWWNVPYDYREADYLALLLYSVSGLMILLYVFFSYAIPWTGKLETKPGIARLCCTPFRLVERLFTRSHQLRSKASLIKVLAWAMATVVGVLVAMSVAGRNFVGEMLGPTFVLVTAGSWIGLLGWRRTLRFRRTFITICIWFVCLLPVLIGDPGMEYVVLAIVLPWLLVLGLRYSRSMGVVGAFAVIVVVLFLLVTIFEWEKVAPYLDRGVDVGYVGNRVLTFREGPEAISRLLETPVLEDENSGSGTVVLHLRNAVQHIWANRGMAALAGFDGSGFGGAPTRAAGIPHHVVQADSTFSFFVVGDFGIAGGLALLGVYACPLLFLLVSRRDTNPPISIVLIVCSALLLEAVCQAAMNLGLLPFAGRNLPMLSVNSLSDVSRWLVFFTLACQSLYWDWSKVTPEREDRTVVFPIAALGAVALLVVGVASMHLLILPPSQVFDWNKLLDSARQAVLTDQISWDEAEGKVVSKEEFLPLTLIEQEIRRFNLATTIEKLGGLDPAAQESFERRLFQVAALDEYDDLLRQESLRPALVPSPGSPLLFQLIESVQGSVKLPTSRARYTLAVNPNFNNRVELRESAGPNQFPTLSTVEADTETLELAFGDAVLEVRQGKHSAADRIVEVDVRNSGGTLTYAIRSDSGFKSSNGRVRLNFNGKAIGAWRFEYTEDGLFFGKGDYAVQRSRSGRITTWAPSQACDLAQDDRITIPGVPELGANVVFRVTRVRSEPLIGPAWASGQWRLVAGRDLTIPWSWDLINAAVLAADADELGVRSFEKKFGRLTIDRNWQRACQRTVRLAGRQAHRENLEGGGDRLKRVLPPRAALTVVDLTNGHVLGLGSWPANASSDTWEEDTVAGILPSREWLEHIPPAGLRNRYLGDRNFDLLPMGSATKPMWAAAVLRVHPQIDDDLVVYGDAGTESEVFGISVPGESWLVQSEPAQGCDFDDFLAYSSNRYLIRLGFLGLAERSSGTVATEKGLSPSNLESMDGGRTRWHRYPVWPVALRFSLSEPQIMEMEGLRAAPMMDSMRRLFGISLEDPLAPIRDVQAQISFWTGDEGDNAQFALDRHSKAEGDAELQSLVRFSGLSPTQANLRLDLPPTDLNKWRARDFVSTLLGGSTNAWSNTHFAAAFGSVVAGKPVVAHVTDRVSKPDPERVLFPALARELRLGLSKTLTVGTARSVGTRLEEAGLPRDVSAYAKTGTLGGAVPLADEARVSRIVIALVRWKDENAGDVERGLVISLAVENSSPATATRHMADFVRANASLIGKHFDPVGSSN